MTQADIVQRWPYMVGGYTREEVEWAVADENWQSFRLSLKGIPTNMKLAKLVSRYDTQVRIHESNDPRLFRKHKVQIDNYLNALKRGGQLNEQYEVQR